jgi:uncharacterized protein (DUF39 family)
MTKPAPRKSKNYAEINRRVQEGNAVVLTKDEFLAYVNENGLEKSAREVDVVTTGTFGPMCSSGAFLNIGHTKPRIKIGGGSCLLNQVPAYAGLAAVDVYIGATAVRANDPRNDNGPGKFTYGGGHVIHDLVSGKDIDLVADAYGTDCYPRKRLETRINIKEINEAVLCNPRNAYQNYNCAVNLSNRTIYTYMGILKPDLGNAHYCSAGQLSPLFNDPLYRTIGVGTRIFLGGGIGHVFSKGTQHNPEVKRGENGTPKVPAGTLAVTGDLKQMSPDWLVGVSFQGYGATLRVGIGVPIPILDEEMARFASVTDENIFTQIIDYSDSYPNLVPGSLGEVSYAALRSGKISVKDREVPVSNLSNYPKAVEISKILKDWVRSKKMPLVEPLEALPSIGSGYTFKPLKERAI